MEKRNLLIGLATGATVLTYPQGANAGNPCVPAKVLEADDHTQYDVKRDFCAIGDGIADDTTALQTAISAGSHAQRPVRLPPGSYRTTRPLQIPSNTAFIGSARSTSFGCRIEPYGCAAFVVGGNTSSFHCSIENLLIWPKGPAPESLISVDNSYSVSLRNIRIHNAQSLIKRAAILLLGSKDDGGHGPSGNIVWENLIVRNDTDQSSVAILAAKGCGSHRFIVPDLENYQILLEWQGGQVDFLLPYTERAGQFGVNCNLSADDDSAHFNTFGGRIDCASSGLGCAIRETTRNFNSFGTSWGDTAQTAAYVYALPAGPVAFYGLTPNLTESGRARFAGVPGWRSRVRFAQSNLGNTCMLNMHLDAHAQSSANVEVPGVAPNRYWARVTFNSDPRGTQLSAHVSADDTVKIVAYNMSERQYTLSGLFTVECGLV